MNIIAMGNFFRVPEVKAPAINVGGAANRTKLSADKLSLLLQSLVNVKKRTQKDLPGDLEDLIDNVLKSQGALVDGIDSFLHRVEPWKADDKETISTIINVCPEFLHTKDQEGYIPITSCADGGNHEANMLYLPYLAKVGLKHKVGGEHGRGGLIVGDNAGFNALINCAFNDKYSHEVMKVLMKMDPPLFKKEDVSNYALIHNSVISATNCNDMVALDFYIDLDPSGLFQQVSNGCYPITDAKDRIDIAQYVLKKALKYNPRHPSIGGLISTCENGTSLLQHFITKFGRKRTWDMLEKEISPYKNIPILHQMINCTPKETEEVTKRFPHALFLRDVNNRLPVHVALEKGIRWSNGLNSIIYANMEHLNDKDPITGYFPFALAAKEPRCDLRTINYLLRMHPGQIQSGIDNTRKKKKNKDDDSNNDNDNHGHSKRRRIE